MVLLLYYLFCISYERRRRGPIEALNRGAEPFFSNFFSKANFSKLFGEVWKKSLEKVWKKVGNQSELRRKMFLRRPFVRRFPSFVSRHDHVAIYDDDNIIKSKADPIFCWACTLQPSAGPGPPSPAITNTTRHANGQRPSWRFDHQQCYGSGYKPAIQWASLFQ